MGDSLPMAYNACPFPPVLRFINSGIISLSAISSWYDEEVEKDEEFAREMPLPVPSGTSCEAFTRMSTAQRQRSYQRFYKAVMAHWVAVEMLWFAKVKFINLLGSATKFSNMFGTCGLTTKNNGHFRKR